MQTFLDLPEDEQRVAFEQTAAATGLAATSVEKDFWVCWALQELFAMPLLADSLVFRGGTSLSKVWGIIDRFSEDIDLTIGHNVLDWEPGVDLESTNGKQRQKELKALRDAGSRFVREKVLADLTGRLEQAAGGRAAAIKVDADDEQTLLLHYPAVTGRGLSSYLAQIVKMEFGVRSEPWPTKRSTIRSMVAEKFPGHFGNSDVSVNALLPTRTLVEKILALHEETCRPQARAPKPRMARHYYDVHRLAEAGTATEVLADFAMIDRVLRHRAIYFRQNWMDYDALRAGNLRIRLLPEQESAWRRDYEAMGEEMFRGTPPPFDDLLQTAGDIERRFNALAKARPPA